MGNDKYFQLNGTSGLFIPIRFGSSAVMPFADVGAGIVKSPGITALLRDDSSSAGFFDWNINLALRWGFMFTFTKTPGFFWQMFFQRNFMLDDAVPNSGVMGVGVGYGF